MKSAVQTLYDFGIVRVTNDDDVVKAMKQYAEDAIRECAERATAWMDNRGGVIDYGVNEESILALITELK